MKTKTLTTSLGTLLIVGALTGCNKPSSNSDAGTTPPPAAPEAAQPAATTPNTDTMSAAAATAVSQTKTAVTNATAAMTDAVSAAKAKADTIISQAKSFINDQKYSDALDALNKLSSMALTPEQQKTVDDLKAQVKQLMAGGTNTLNAAKSLFGK